MPSDLRALWTSIGVATAPSRHIFDNLPGLPAINNTTGGVTSPDNATRLEQAFWRAGAIVTWSAAHAEPGLILFSGAGDPITAAVAGGSSVSDPACDVYPLSFKVVAITNPAVTWLKRQFQNGGGSIGVVARYQGTPSCAVTASKGGQTSTITNLSFTSHTLYLTGEVIQDPVLGTVWERDSRADCAAAGAPVECT
ncbi:MAG: hypothetical protein JF886_08555 [Candidatus Dormibacteraeota bacterium]|uniref:Uncharacterized protein n=1 Tax=Candidatus Aeolococcus gillhamiae TaxID=3127015 RepID=A0A934K114_9BACT|nr:hypothetical protein [Candidatus Dormibacteraeota bacterium]